MNTQDLDPKAGILADLENLRKSRGKSGVEEDHQETTQVDQNKRDVLEDIARVAEDKRREATAADAAEKDQDTEPQQEHRRLDPLSSIFSNLPGQVAQPENLVTASAGDSFDPKAVFSAAQQDEDEQVEPVKAPSSNFLTFQQPQAELGEVVDPTWTGDDEDEDDSDDDDNDASDSSDDSESSGESGDNDRRRRRRGGRGRRSRSREDSGDSESQASSSKGEKDSDSKPADAKDSDDDNNQDSSRRRRRRRVRSAEDSVTGVKGSTRLEAKRQRRREGREAGRRRPLITEAEFLARRESVERTMIVREHDGRTQLVVTEDGIAVEHYLSEAKAQASLIGNVYLGKVQNVLPSMEAAFVDIGKGRNAVLYAGEVNWDVLGMDGKPHRIEVALNPGDSVLVQVTKDPIGHKGARLTSQISLPGRFLVYVPNNAMTGISRKLPDKERQRLRKLLGDAVPEGNGVIVRTAAEGASEEELTRDIDRLAKRWQTIEKKSTSTKVLAPQLLYSEPDMIVRIIRDVFNEDFTKLVIDGDGVYDTIHEYVESVAPDLVDRVERYTGDEDVFDHFRVSEQIEKALSRKVNLPSGGSLVIDRTEAMTVIDVNTGKFTGSGGNLEETVTKNNLEAAEEVIRQLRLRDIGGIIVVDFIDMVLESNRDLVVRRLVECLGRDRTKHQVAEVTSLGLVQMTRKRIGTGLAESLVAAGEDLSGRGLVLPGTEVDNSKQYKSRKKRTRPNEKSSAKPSSNELTAIAAATMRSRQVEGAEAQEEAQAQAADKESTAAKKPVADEQTTRAQTQQSQEETQEAPPEAAPIVHAPGTVMIGDDSETKIQKAEPKKRPAVTPKAQKPEDKAEDKPREEAPALPVLIIGDDE
ncbi:Rne/Rng family ribonuclease [Brevibacterium sp. UMB1308A]|uniref:Rne/Rng family ribonuclease n=1 Tax=Brevibacterium sp. UMB1308A TaxID=3050608 RepID=UPI00254AA388|nr:Rne/Rng family ribonuclease [Brevibacterium sp. UMB1308A]MDK8347337.1 Rne/Rng family ribonuclease [Brevibacterium sp. UMB1308B]MDK8714442.1 Rne/Rng family ribonuclease [Brevibacterium sp. UMB1308A]